MADTPVPPPPDPEEIGRLTEEASRALHFGRLAEAEVAGARLLALNPSSTSAHELHGDVLRAQNDRRGAREAYRRAMELEPANADAERKYAELALALGSSDRQHQALLSGDFQALRADKPAHPVGSAVRSALFPGLGQLYNGDFELGILLATLGFLLFAGFLVYFAAPLTDSMVRSIGKLPPSGGIGALGWISLIGLMGVYAYSIWEAYRAAAPSAH